MAAESAWYRSITECQVNSMPAWMAFPGGGVSVDDVDDLTSSFSCFHGYRKPKRIRTAFSPNQLVRLEEAFDGNQYVVGEERKDLAASLSLSETQVYRQLFTDSLTTTISHHRSYNTCNTKDRLRLLLMEFSFLFLCISLKDDYYCIAYITSVRCIGKN